MLEAAISEGLFVDGEVTTGGVVETVVVAGVIGLGSFGVVVSVVPQPAPSKAAATIKQAAKGRYF